MGKGGVVGCAWAAGFDGGEYWWWRCGCEDHFIAFVVAVEDDEEGE
jgi:hypothetical protein